MENTAYKEAMGYFKKMNDGLFLAIRYIDKNGVIVIPSDSNMPVFSELPSHFCVNGVILDKGLFSQYKAICILQLLEDHPWLIDVYPSILPESRTIVKIAKVLRTKDRKKIHQNCSELREALCPGIISLKLADSAIETYGNKQLEAKLDVHVFPIYYHDGTFFGITKAFSDQYLSVYRKIKALLDKTDNKKDLIGKCMISYAIENGKFIATLFLDDGGDIRTYYDAVGKLKEYVTKHRFSVGFPMQGRDGDDFIRQKEKVENIVRLFDGYCIYILN
ncbi:MAG: hypothetical protein ABF904_06875 [Ethanoligenens sp.]